MTVPLISVVLPVYNGEPYVAAALESILRQDYRCLEVIALDDGSTDRSLNILQRYREVDHRVRIVSRENRGLVATLNEGIALAKGDLIARMDADDVSYPSRFSRQVAQFAQQPQLAMSGTGIDQLLGNRVVRGKPNPIYQSGDWHVLSLFFTIFLHSTVMFNRKPCCKLHPYDGEKHRQASCIGSRKLYGGSLVFLLFPLSAHCR